MANGGHGLILNDNNSYSKFNNGRPWRSVILFFIVAVHNLTIHILEEPLMRRVVFNQKGGVGKSTITSNLAAIAAHQGQRTLLVDLDAQGNSSRYLLGEMADVPHPGGGSAGFFDSTLKFSFTPTATHDFIRETPWENLHLMGASPELEELHSKLESRYKIYKLRDALAELGEDYDEIWIDTPPALNFYTRSALIAADSCLIPFDCDEFSRRALYALLDNVKEIQADHNAHLQVEGIVVNQFQPRASLPKRTVQELVEEGLPVLAPYLSASVKVKESHELSRPMVHLDPRHKLTQEFVALYASLAPHH
jgi:chromosome partitioning protein